ncbi:MAG: hypothetical protein JSU07_08300 [Bacteroidetes bacterium]|nr:hypothetical protein [Bacteroidota bacterium]
MSSLSEILYKNHIIFSYFGYIDNMVLNEILKLTKDKLIKNKESVLTTNRVYNAINECVENIIKHNIFSDDNKVYYKSLILISTHSNAYQIDTINLINENQYNEITEKLKLITSKNKEELKHIKTEIISNNQYSNVSTAGLGLIDMLLKADEFLYRFNKQEDSKILFNMHFKIYSK